jgi:hypothetical protein
LSATASTDRCPGVRSKGLLYTDEFHIQPTVIALRRRAHRHFTPRITAIPRPTAKQPWVGPSRAVISATPMPAAPWTVRDDHTLWRAAERVIACDIDLRAPATCAMLGARDKEDRDLAGRRVPRRLLTHHLRGATCAETQLSLRMPLLPRCLQTRANKHATNTPHHRRACLVGFRPARQRLGDAAWTLTSCSAQSAAG